MTDQSPVSIGDDAPLCAAPQAELRAPKHHFPINTCDTHMHICGPGSDFPYDSQRIYTPPDALVSDYIKQLKTLGIARTVLVQPSVYGSDNQVLLGAMSELARAGFPCRGVAVVDHDVSDVELARLNEAGVRGLRYNLVDVADPTKGLPLDEIRAMATRIAPMGWHVEFLAHADDYPTLDSLFGDFPTDIVLGHTGYMRMGKSVDVRGFHVAKGVKKRDCSSSLEQSLWEPGIPK